MGDRTLTVCVVGDAGVGKTSLIVAAVQEAFSDTPVPVLPVSRFPAELLHGPEGGTDILVVDTSSKPEDARATEAALRAAAAVVVCVDATRHRTLERLRAHWLPEVARLAPAAPVVVAVCKDDREDCMDMGTLREVRRRGRGWARRAAKLRLTAHAAWGRHACCMGRSPACRMASLWPCTRPCAPPRPWR